MMPCPQCGQPVTIGSPACPTCGLRFGAQVERGRPGGNVPQGGQAPFDDGMPGWLRQIQGGPGGQTPPQAPQSYQPPASQLPANSLMSGDALPGWLREVGATPAAPNPYAPPTQAQMPPNYPSRMPQQPFQQPQWPQQMASDPRDPRQQRIPSPGGAAIASNALFDEASLPEWLRQSGGQGGDQPTIQQAPSYAPPSRVPFNGASPYAPPAPNGYPAAEPTAQSAFPSLDQAVALPRGLPSPAISPVPQGDGGTLPGWLGGGMQPPDSGQRSGVAGMAAQSLIDETALPTWLRSQPQVPQARQGQLAQPANTPSVAWGAPPPPAAPQWNQPAEHTFQSPAPQQVGAGSFVDEGALPGWLRAQSGGQPSPGAGYGPMNAAQQNAGMDGGYLQAGGAQGTQPQYGPGDHAEHAPGQFSASDLIDPKALPSWVQRTGDAQASFSSSAGWSVQQPTTRQPRPDAADLASRGVTGRQPAYDVYSEREPSPQREDLAPPERGRQTGAYPAASGQIPQNELPPWLQGAPSAGAGRGRSGSYEGQPSAQRGRQDDPYQDEWDNPTYDAASSHEPYPGEFDAEQQGYGDPYDARYGYDPRQDQGYADEYEGAPPPRRQREQHYGVGSDEAYGDLDYDRVGGAWQQQENDNRGDGKRGGWRRFFGRR